MTDHQNKHIPVLLSEVLTYLAPKPGGKYLDLTAGYGGHANAVLEKTKASAVLVDRDEHAVDYLQKQFSGQKADIRHQDFLGASAELLEAGEQFDMILADLGVSSPHLDNASRGFSLKSDGPLDMRMDNGQALSAHDIVNDYDEAKLAEIIYHYGEEPKSRRIAKRIVENRPIQTTHQLAAIVSKASGAFRPKVHPATKTFQALRIAVNQELEQLERALPLWIELLKPAGRLVVISFHSLEDRIVKQALAEHSGKRYDAELQILTSRPVTANKHELVSNPRARSAKLRAAVKIKTDPSTFL